MLTKVKVIFNRRKNGTLRGDATPKRASVEIEITTGSRRRWISTGVLVYLDQWREGFVVNHIDAQELNVHIRKLYEDACRCAKVEGADVTIVRAERMDFCDWMEAQIEERTDIELNTRRDHLRTVTYLREFGLFSRFTDLTERNVTLWDQWLKRRLGKQSAVHGYHKRLKTYISRAMHLGLLKDTPYRFVKVPKGKSETIKYLTPEERDRVEALKLSGALAKVRDMFIFACYTGLAYCDLVRVKDCLTQEEGQWFIDGSRLKTKVRYKLRILPKALSILERYNYDLALMSNQKCNMNLKAVQAMAGISTNLTMHVGRHTFATWALKMGVELPVVSKMLAHTNIMTTQIYAKVLQSEVSKGFDKLMQ